MEENQKSNKRQKLDKQEGALRITELPEVLLKHCLSFVGPGQYRFVAGTCHHFREQYSFPKETTWKNAVASVSRAKLCEKDCIEVPQSFPQNRIFPPIKMIVRNAIPLGKLDVIQWAVDERGYVLRQRDYKASCASGHLHVVEWLVPKNPLGICIELFCEAALNGHVHVLEWLSRKAENVSKYSRYVIARSAAFGGHVTVFDWMNDKGLLNEDFDGDETYVWSVAADQGHVHVLQWLFDFGFANRFPTSKVLYPAIRHGHFDVLRWARDHRVGELEASCCEFAAAYGKLEVLQWLRDNGCAWDGETISVAMMHGYPTIAQWSRDNGCPEPNGL